MNLKVLTEVAKVSNPRIQLPDNFFLLYCSGYQLKPVKWLSKVLDYNMCPRYYYALHTSIYLSITNLELEHP